jgi:hypothetical protein
VFQLYLPLQQATIIPTLQQARIAPINHDMIDVLDESEICLWGKMKMQLFPKSSIIISYAKSNFLNQNLIAQFLFLMQILTFFKKP